MHSRFTYLALFCYVFIQGIVPTGYMPGSIGSATPFVLCHGNTLSAKWIDAKDSLTTPAAQSLKASMHDSSSGLHDVEHGELQCQFSTLYFSSLFESHESASLQLLQQVFSTLSFRPSVLQAFNYFPLNPRAPPLLNDLYHSA